MDAASVLEQQTQSMSNIPDEIQYILQEMREKDMQAYEIRKKMHQRDVQLQKYAKQNGSLAKHPREAQIYAKINEDFEQAKQLQNEKCLMANTALFLLSKHLASLEKDVEKLEATGATPKILGVDPESGAGDGDSMSALSSSMADSSIGSLTPSPPPTSRNRRGHNNHGGSGSNNHNSSRSRSHRSRSRSRSSSIERSSSGRYDSVSRDASVVRSNGSALSGSGAGGISAGTATVAGTGGRRRLERGASGTVTIPKRSGNNEDDELYCFCRQVSYGDMIACDNQNCRYEWFHYGCVGLTEPPKGIWYCPDCRKQMELDRKRKKRN